jgi:hypothetical protein
MRKSEGFVVSAEVACLGGYALAGWLYVRRDIVAEGRPETSPDYVHSTPLRWMVGTAWAPMSIARFVALWGRGPAMATIDLSVGWLPFLAAYVSLRFIF